MKKTFTLIFDEDDLQVLNKALIDIPYKYAVSIIQKINSQIQNSILPDQDIDNNSKKYGSELM
jgi:hypothetical protein